MHTVPLTLALVLLAALGPAVHAQPPAPPVVDVNGPHVILRSRAPRAWNHLTVEINRYWTFTLTGVPASTSVCIHATAFTVKASRRGGRDFDGIHFDPASMQVKTVSLSGANGPATALRVTRGLTKPLTRQDATRCLGAEVPTKS